MDGLPLLRPEEQVFEAMLDGWRNQQLARNLALSTTEKRAGRLRAFFAHAGAYPWEWAPQHADEWFGGLWAVRGCSHSTMRSCQDALRSFCAYVSGPVYDWPAACEQRFGTHPIQIVHEWNSAVHVQDNEGRPSKRAFTIDEGRRHRRGVCGNCVLAERLALLLDDGTGRIRRELVPFAGAFCQMRRPRGGLTWIGRPHVQKMLRTLADPGTPVTHETLNGMSPWRSVAYLRDLLMVHGVLPPVDRSLTLFERWLDETLAGIGRPGHRQLIERFASWHARRRLRGFAARGPVTGKQTQQARSEVCQAIAFLAWLRGRGRTLTACRQADVDAWYAGAYTARRLTHAFLRWAMSNKLLPRSAIPHQDTANPAPISQRQRLDLLQRLLTDEEIALLTRVAAVLMLLYAQPLTRILSLTIDDVSHRDGEVTIRLGEPPAPVPDPFASLLLRYAGQRLNLTTATNAGARWLFPGRRGGQPMTPDSIERRLRLAGIPARNGRTAALRQLVLQAPAPVIATVLGYKHQQAARVAAEAGSPWSRYAPGDHDRPPSGKGDS